MSKQQDDRNEQTNITRDPERTVAEWVSLGISLTILILLIGLVFYSYLRGGDKPAVLEVEPQWEKVRVEADNFYLPLQINNTGSHTAREITIQITLDVENTSIRPAPVHLAFLAGGDTAHGVVIFNQDPADGELQIFISFVEP